MSRRGRAAIVAALAAILAGPIATGHPVASHLFASGGTGALAELRHGPVAFLLLMVVVSAIPLAGALAVVCRWVGARRTMSGLAARSGIHRASDGTVYRTVPLPGVSFFTLGVLRPVIFASEAAREQLSAEAFNAAILHEREHVRRRDPAWRFGLAMLESALRPIPRVRGVVAALALECEFVADQAAIAAGARPEHLFDAMVAAASPVPAHSAALTSLGVVERLEALATPSVSRRPANAMTLAWVALGMITVPAMAHGLFWVGAVCL